MHQNELVNCLMSLVQLIVNLPKTIQTFFSPNSHGVPSSTTVFQNHSLTKNKKRKKKGGRREGKGGGGEGGGGGRKKKKRKTEKEKRHELRLKLHFSAE
jgi:hypothetical protein